MYERNAAPTCIEGYVCIVALGLGKGLSQCENTLDHPAAWCESAGSAQSL